MTDVYIVDCTLYTDEHTIIESLPRMESRRQKKIQALLSPQKKAQSIAAGLLLEKLFGSNVEYRYSEDGKPYLPDNSAYFSISHSERWVALAVSDREIGFDLQVTSPIRPAVLRHIFTKAEQEWISEDARRFTQLWARKEAYGKFIGSGLTPSFKDDISKIDTLFCEGAWDTALYALYGDDTLTIHMENAAQLLTK